jgi:TRAP-type C4-dicarboxylate transport system substrate-binding protein
LDCCPEQENARRNEMKRRRFLTVIGSIGLVLVLTVPSLAQVITLRLADQNPETAWGPSTALQPWVKKVEEVTKGRVKIEYYPGQTLVKGPEMWNSVKTGFTDMGWCFHGFWPDMTPLAEVVTLPSLPFTSAEKGSEVFWNLYQRFPGIQREFKDVHLLFVWTSQPYLLVTTKKQVKTMEDLKGLKIKVLGGPPMDQMKALGGVPVPVTMPDTYMALDKGVIDGAALPWEAVSAYRFYEVSKYYTVVPLHTVSFSMPMNKQKWESLPADIQQAITSVSGLEAAKFWGHNWFDTAEEDLIKRLKGTNYQIMKYTLPTEEVQRWTKVAGEPIWEKWVKRLESKGYPEAQQVLNTTLEMLK